MKPLAENYSDVLDHIDQSKSVEVYRNLHRKCLSVRQGGIVRCHAKDGVCLKDATFVVREKGRDKVRQEKKKNVHAFVRGFVIRPKETYELLDFGWQSIFYNPYLVDFWTEKDSELFVEKAQYVDIHRDGLSWDVLAFNFLYVGGCVS